MFAGLSDMGIIAAVLVAALWGNSLMMAAETLRGTLRVEVVLGFRSQHPIGDIQVVVDHVSKDVGDLIPGAFVSIIPVASRA
jgi:hypothetical protein